MCSGFLDRLDAEIERRREWGECAWTARDLFDTRPTLFSPLRMPAGPEAPLRHAGEGLRMPDPPHDDTHIRMAEAEMQAASVAVARRSMYSCPCVPKDGRIFAPDGTCPLGLGAACERRRLT